MTHLGSDRINWILGGVSFVFWASTIGIFIYGPGRFRARLHHYWTRLIAKAGLSKEG